jgi:photosystem II stability/assembly factor-like uncharacterized protein
MKTANEAFINTFSNLIHGTFNGHILSILLIVVTMTVLHPAGANAQEQLLRDHNIQLPERPESVPDLIFHARADGTGISLQSDVDSDGDGIPNWLEIEGYTFNPGTGALETCTDEELSVCFRTDPLRWSTDGDPYSDFMEATGVNMPAGVRSPFRHPLVAARPVINVRLASYDVTPIETITDVSGGEQSSSFTNTTQNQTDMGFDIGLGLAKDFLNPSKLLSGDIGFSYSNTSITTESSTTSSSMNWSKSRSSQPNEAAELRLNLYMTNSGHATARNVRPTFNLVLAGKTIATFKISADDAANSLTEANTQNSRYPLNGTIAIDRDSGGNKIILTMNELRAIQMGAPLSLVVTQVDADVVRWNPANNSFDSNIAWTSFENEIDAATIRMDIVRGTDIFTYNIYAGTEAFDPGHTLGKLLPVVMDLDENSGQIYLGGNAYPDSWYSITDSQPFIDVWNAAGQPTNLLDLPAIDIGNMVMISPPESSKPKISIASYTPDMRDVLVITRPDAGLPVDSVWAEVTVNGENRRLQLSKSANSAFYTYSPKFESEALFGGKVIVQDARGVQNIQNLSAGPLNAECKDIRDYSGLLTNGTYLLYVDYDPEKPSEAWCHFYDAQTQLLETPLTSYWIPREAIAEEYLNGGIFMDEDRGVMLGRNGIWLTEDGGDNWELRHNSRIPEGGINPNNWYETWSQAVAMGGDTLLAVGQRDVFSDPVELLSLSADGGKTWEQQVLTDYRFFNWGATERIVAIDSRTAIVYGHRTRRTLDGGVTWEPYDIATEVEPNGIAFYNGIGIAIRDRSEVFRTTDGEEEWERLPNSIPFNNQIVKKVVMTDENTVMAISAESNGAAVSTLMRSTDQGENWAIQTFPFRHFEDMIFEGQTGFILTRDGVILRSGDGGETWEENLDMRVFGTQPWSGVVNKAFVPAHKNRIFAIGNDGQMFRTTSGGGFPEPVPTSIETPGKEQTPREFTLSQNYPNPFNPVTTIQFTLSGPDDITLTVYDLLGRRVAVLLNGSLPAGTHSAVFDARHLASGVYLYRIVTAQGQSETRKMMLLK